VDRCGAAGPAAQGGVGLAAPPLRTRDDQIPQLLSVLHAEIDVKRLAEDVDQGFAILGPRWRSGFDSRRLHN